MKTDRNQKPIPRGLTLLELLIALAVISTLAGISVGAMSNTTGAAKPNTAKLNAQNLCSLYHRASTAGARFASDSKEGILDEMIEGKAGVDIGAGPFKMSPLNEEEKMATLAYCVFDEHLRTLSYSEGAKEVRVAAPRVPNENWSNWRPALSELLDGENLSTAMRYFASHYPEYQFKAEPDSSEPGLSKIVYRYPVR